MLKSKEEYWKEHKLFKKKLKKIRTTTEFNLLLNNAEKIGLFAKEDILKLRNRFNHLFLSASKDKPKWIKKEIKQRLKFL